jgi:hypothetical protein
MPVLVFKLGIVPYNLLNIMTKKLNQEEKHKLQGMTSLHGDLYAWEARQMASNKMAKAETLPKKSKLYKDYVETAEYFNLFADLLVKAGK